MSQARSTLRAFTLIEVLIAISVAAFVCLAAVSFMFSAIGNSETGLMRADELAIREIVIRRLDPILSNNIGLLDGGDGWGIFWAADLDGDTLPGTGELDVVFYEEEDRAVRMSTLDINPELDVDLTLLENFETIASQMLSHPLAVESVLVEGVERFELVWLDADPMGARSVVCNISLGKLAEGAGEIRMHERFRLEFP